jgi:hypothetical protein
MGDTNSKLSDSTRLKNPPPSRLLQMYELRFHLGAALSHRKRYLFTRKTFVLISAQTR